jgi:hypothetical protein
MRAVVILFLLLVGMSCREKNLAGTAYSTGPDLAGDIYYFKTDSTFESRGWTCLGGDTGLGRYKLTKDSLVFYYDTLDSRKGRYVEVDSSVALGDTCIINILCRDDSSVIPNAAVAVSSKGPMKGAITNVEGKATFRIAKTDFPVKISFAMAGYQRLIIEVTRARNFDFNVKLRPAMVFNIPPGTVHAYAAKKVTKKEIRLEFDYTDPDSVKKTARRNLRRVK